MAPPPNPESFRILNTSAETADRQAGVFRQHSRKFEENKFVYPVVSRRSEGLSIGINLNPDRICNFDCIYCQVDRRSDADTKFVNMDQLLNELQNVLELAVSGDIYASPRFQDTPLNLRRLNDIAFSGDGEPTSFVNFDEIVSRTAEVRGPLAPAETKMVLITNASMFHREHVKRGLRILDRNHGQIWAKLDAGTEDYYHLIERTTIPFQQILDNITAAAQIRPLVIQSLFMNVHEEAPSYVEISEYCNRLNEVKSAGGRIELVQIYTVARQPAESFVSPLTAEQLDNISNRIRSECGLKAKTFA
ncbi:MAG: radical SAM protein [Fuerstiella sp.]|nr:radical SAM protein [Fuerstiella sp.]